MTDLQFLRMKREALKKESDGLEERAVNLHRRNSPEHSRLASAIEAAVSDLSDAILSLQSAIEIEKDNRKGSKK